jgi:hypothetical protein
LHENEIKVDMDSLQTIWWIHNKKKKIRDKEIKKGVRNTKERIKITRVAIGGGVGFGLAWVGAV